MKDLNHDFEIFVATLETYFKIKYYVLKDKFMLRELDGF